MPSWPPRIEHLDRGEGPAVVLLHGQPGSAADWDLVVAQLDGVRAIVPDRPGYGRTGGRAAGIGANAAAVVALLDELSVPDAVIVGYSWAGAVALHLARHHRRRVAGMVLVASIGAAGSIDDLDRALTLPIIGPALALGGLSLLQLPIIRRVVAPLAVVPRAPLDTWRSFMTEQRAMVDELPAITAVLADIDVDAVVVTGAGDRVVRPATQAALAAALPRASAVNVPAAGHLLPWEAPEVIASAVRRVIQYDSSDQIDRRPCS